MNHNPQHRPGQRSFQSKGLKEVRITGWEKSKAAGSNDGGVAELVAFIERRANIAKEKHAAAKGYTAEPVRVRKSRIEGNVLHVWVIAGDLISVTRLNGYSFAGANIAVKEATSRSPSPDHGPPNGPRGAPRNNTRQSGPGGAAAPASADVKQQIQTILESRYSQEEKLLNLSSLASDANIQSMGLFNDRRAESKFFPALMKVLDNAFESEEDKTAAITSVMLSNNNLDSLKAVTTVAPTLPGIVNLDLSNNQLKTIDDLRFWKNKFRRLDHLIVTGNPLEVNQPNYAQELMKWYPTLRFLNGNRIRSDEEAIARPPDRPQKMTDAAGAQPAAATAAAAAPIGAVAGTTDQQAKLIEEVSRQTGMTAQYARMCLESAAWDWDKAGELYQQQRATLPPEAFMR